MSGNLEGESGQQYSFNGYLDEYVKNCSWTLYHMSIIVWYYVIVKAFPNY